MKRLKNLLFVLLLALLAWNCQKEESNNYPEPIQEEEDNVRLRALTIDELPDFSSSIAQQTSKVGWASKNDGSDVVLDGSRVLAVTDSVGNTTYSLRMYVADTPHNVFYNVVAKQTYEGVQNKPFVLRYEVDEDYWPEYVAGPREEKPFKGTIGVYTLEAFGLQMDQNGKIGSEPEPCYEPLESDGNGSNGNGGGGNTNNNEGGNDSQGGGNHDPGNYYDYWNSYAPDYGGGVGAGTEPFVEVGQGKFGKFGDNGILKASPTGKSADCPEENTLLPINEEEDVILIPSCQSFEYANGKLVKAAGVSNISNSFIAVGFEANGSPYYSSKELNITKSYFSMPKQWTNGKAANATAMALLTAISKTEAWFEVNYRSSGVQLGIEWERNIKAAMRAIGGDWSKSPPHPIQNLAPYTRDWAWSIKDCSK